ncbi:MAG: HAD hydrolase family protein [Prolixibacteraceae bacterium]
MKNIQLIATDLDGTFLKDDRSISDKNMEALHLLGEKNIIRVVATGRNLRKVNEVLSREVPFDYIVYSSGAGVYNWQEQKQLYDQNIHSDSANRLSGYLIEKDLNFYAFCPVPQNHMLWYRKGTQDCEEFNRYLTFHDSFVRKFPENGKTADGLCQFLLIIPEDEDVFAELKSEIESQCTEIRVIRSSSPVTRGYIWVEVFHRSVSKGHGVRQICDLLNINPQNTVGIGNDYNDLDLLDYTAHSYLTENAPAGIKNRFAPAPSNEKDAFAHIVQPLVL